MDKSESGTDNCDQREGIGKVSLAECLNRIGTAFGAAHHRARSAITGAWQSNDLLVAQFEPADFAWLG
jgi:hypothetical protein